MVDYNYSMPPLKLNFAPILLSNSHFEAYVSDFKSKEQLQALKTEHDDCIFHRKGEEIFCVPLGNSSATFGEKRVIDVSDNMGLISRLIREALINHFADSGATFVNLSPIRIVDDSIDLAALLDIEIPDIRLNPEYEIDLRILSTHNASPLLGIMIRH